MRVAREHWKKQWFFHVCLANLRSGSGFLQSKNERLDTERLHKTVFSVKFEFECSHYHFDDLCLSCGQLSDFCRPGERSESQYVFTTVPWNARGTPVAFTKPDSSSKLQHMLAFGNFDINHY